MEWDIPIYEQEVLRGQLRVERQGLQHRVPGGLSGLG